MHGFSSIKGSGGEVRRWSVWALAASMVAIACLLAIPSPAFAADFVEPPCIYRLYNKWSGEHLFTASYEEYSQLEDIGWNGEGLAWYAPEESASPVYRLYNPYSGDHHYTREKREYDHLGSIGWKQEGVAFYSSEEEDGVPVYRLYNPWLTAGTHLFTTDEEEYDSLGGIGWNKEDVAWYGLNRIASDTFGEGCTWTLDWRGTLTISPTNGVSGTMSSRYLYGLYLQHGFYANKVVIAEGVKAPEDSSYLFSGVDAHAIDVAALDVSGVTRMDGMFDDCRFLSDVSGLSGWDTSSVTDMAQMFGRCRSLSDVSGLSGWDTSHVTDMSWMFWDCGSLSDVSPLSGWDTSSVTDMSVMFNGCDSLSDVSPLSGWDTSSIMRMSSMFGGCPSLSDATPLEGWEVSSSADKSNAFPDGCRAPSWYAA